MLDGGPQTAPTHTIVRAAAILGFTGVAELRERVKKNEIASRSGAAVIDPIRRFAAASRPSI
jgi:hypothetical protein